LDEHGIILDYERSRFHLNQWLQGHKR
jgi:hypothetical protein